MFNEIIRRYNEAVIETDKAAAVAVVDEALAGGASAEDVVFKVVIPAVEEMMAAITKDPDSNLAQHFMTAQIASEVTEKLLRRFVRPPETIGRVVIGTAHGDLHSLGKRIVSGCLRALMVEVVDLGVDVPAEKFVEAAVERDAKVIAISTMMVHTATGEQGCRKVRRLLVDRGLSNKVRVAVGGAPYRFDTGLYKEVGADAWAADGISAAKVISDLIREVA